jgi:hypothetical protein
MDLNRSRDLGYQALERHEREQALVEQFDVLIPRRPATRPADDWRSGSRARAERVVQRVVERE